MCAMERFYFVLIVCGLCAKKTILITTKSTDEVNISQMAVHASTLVTPLPTPPYADRTNKVPSTFVEIVAATAKKVSPMKNTKI